MCYYKGKVYNCSDVENDSLFMSLEKYQEDHIKENKQILKNVAMIEYQVSLNKIFDFDKE